MLTSVSLKVYIAVRVFLKYLIINTIAHIGQALQIFLKIYCHTPPQKMIEMQDHVLSKCSIKFKIKIISQTIETILKTEYKTKYDLCHTPLFNHMQENLKIRRI